MSQVMTVLGAVSPEQLGRVMPHEHLLSLAPGPWLDGGGQGGGRDDVQLAVDALAGLRDLGFGTVVDLSPYGVVGRDADGVNVERLVEISRRTGLHVVSGTALYLEAYSPAWAREASLDEVVDRLVRDVESGIGETGVRAGVLGEQATGLGEMTPHEHKCLVAAARTAARTGLALMTHTTHGTLALDQVELVRAEGLDLDRVVIGHLDTQLEVDLARRVLDSGARVAVDTIGKEDWDFFLGPREADRPEGEYAKRAFHRSDASRADLVATLVAEGYADRIVLAQDLTGAEVWLNPGTHGTHGYGYLHQVFRLLLLERGVSQEAYDTMTVSTPAALLTVAA
jgi:predicted metal-dependent phosphotriesterase family hydrolase